AIPPPWETKTDYDLFVELAEKISHLAKGRLDTRKDLVAAALQHDTPGQVQQPGGIERDWKNEGVNAVPGVNMPNLTVIERDYTAIADKLVSVGPLAEKRGFTAKNINYDVKKQVRDLAEMHGVFPSGPAAGRAAIDTDERMAEAILMFSGTTNGELSTQGFATLEGKTGRDLVDLSEGSEERRISF